MSNQKNLPLFRVKFCSITGIDKDNKEQLSAPVEIGAVWRRNDPTKGAIMKLDIVPQDIHHGVILLQTPQPKSATTGGAQ